MDVSDEADADPWGKDEKRITKIVFIGALVTGGDRGVRCIFGMQLEILILPICNTWIFPGTVAICGLWKSAGHCDFYRLLY